MNTEKYFNEFVRYCTENDLKIEGVAVSDGSRVLHEHHFVFDQPRNIYSHTKSYMVTAAGMAIDDGLLSLDTTIAELFPDKLPENPSPELLEIRLKHFLTMSSGFGKPYLMGAMRRTGQGFPDYVKFMLSREVSEKPGSRFEYSTADSIMAGRMVEKVTGKNLSEYLYERLFSKLGQGFPLWENDPQGHPIGGGGMSLKLTEMMKLGQLYLNNGKWNGERIVSEDWVRKCGTKQIDMEKNGDVWKCGYGYQFWISPYPDSYRADGAYGQITTILPKSGLVVAVQCPEDGDFGKVKLALHEQLLLPLSE